MCKGICRSRVSQVICRYINSLYRCDRTVLGRGDTLLKSAHLCLQRRLISYCGRHTSQQSRYLRTCLSETENIINKQQYVLTALITEILCHSKSCQTYSHTCSRRLVHLTEYHGGFIDNSGISHLIVKVISFTGTLAYAGEYRISAVLCGDVTNQLLNQYGFAYAGAAEQTDFTTLLIGAQKVNDLDTCLQNLCLCRLFLKGRSFSVDWKIFFHLWLFFIVNGLAQHVENTPQRILTNRNRNRRSGCNGVHTTS